MKKILFLVAFCAATIIGINPAAHANFPKVPLMERFTGVNCGPCASYNNAGYNNWVNANKNNLAIITYHLNWPSGTDPMYSFNTAIPNTRVTQYQGWGMPVSGIPEVKFNGATAGNGMPNNTLLTNLLNTELAKTVPVSITPTITIDNGIASVNVEVFSTAAMSGVRLQVLILQQEVVFATAPGSNGEKHFPFVARYALPNMNGEVLTLTANGTISRSFIQDLNTVPQQPASFYVVAFLEETASSHNIVQAGVSAIGGPAAIKHTLNLKLNPTGAGTVSGSGTYEAGSQAVISATANTCFSFVNWTDSATNNVVSQKALDTITVTKNQTLIANFARDSFDLVPTVYPQNAGTVSGFGKYNCNSTATITATANIGYRFKNWTLEDETILSANNPHSMTVTKNMNIQANFEELASYSLTVNAGAGGSVGQHGGFTAVVFEGDTVKLTATANVGFTFASWTDANDSIISTQNPFEIVVISDTMLTANFVVKEVPVFTVTLISNPANAGTVSGHGSYDSNSVATISATANSGYKFRDWTDLASGNVFSTLSSFSMEIAKDMSLVANFDTTGASVFTVSLSANPTGAGTVSGAGSYDSGAVRQISATANSGYKFVSWTENGNVISNNAIYSFTLLENKTFVANFEETEEPEETFTIEIGAISPAGAGTVTGYGEYAKNTAVILEAIPNSGYEFVNWTDENGNEISTENPFTFILTQDTVIIANFGLGISENKLISDIRILPNPVSSNAIIEINCIEAQPNTVITILDISGREVLNVHIGLLVEGINTFAMPNNLPSGSYILSVQNNNGQNIKQFIIAR